jgi:glutamyl-tRNA reductase
VSEELLAVGVSHRTAPIALRDRLAVAVDDLAIDRPHVVLSTCNRLELYVEVEEPHAEHRVVAALARAAGLPERELAAAATAVTGERAVVHLFRVAAGLDSPILGESQILGQVRSAAAAGGAGPLLGRLFAAAVHAGRRARHETSLGERAGSLAASTVAVAAEYLGGLDGRRVLVVGAGSIGELVAGSFRSQGCEVTVASRTHERARVLASRVNGRAMRMDALRIALAEADVVVSCTRSPGVVIGVRELAAERRLLVVDLALPRDVDPAVGSLPGCTLYDLDGLNARAGAAHAPTDAELAAEAIVAEEAERFCAWRRSRSVATAITSLRGRAEAIRAAELARMRAKLDGLSPAERHAVETLTAQIVNKLLHEPTISVKQAAGEELVPALCRLFALEEAA